MSYGKRLEIKFMSYSGISFTFDIYKRDYTGAVDERDGCPPAVEIDWGDGANDSMPCLMGSKATVVFYSETQGEFSEFYAADNRQFYGELVDNYGQRYWRGWIVPEQRNEVLGYKSPVSLTFLDGIGELKNMDFLDGTGAAYTGRHSYLYYILEILNKLETGMNVSMQVDFRPEGLSATQCPFENMFVDATIYEGLKCSEVLEQLLAGCRLMQTFNQTDDSYWLVQSFASLQNYAKLTPGITPAIELVTFTSTPAGVVTLTGERPYIAINDDTLFHSNDPQFTNWSAWNYMDLKNTYSLIDNVLTNGSFEDDFSDWTPLVTMPSPLMDIFLLDDGTKALHVKGGTAGTGSRYDHKLLAKTFTGLKATTKSLKLSFKYNLYVGATGKATGESANWIYVGCYITRDSDGAKIYCSRNYDLSLSKAYLEFDVAEEDLYYGPWGVGFGVTATRDSEGNWTNTSITPAIAEKASEMIDFDILIKEIPADCSLTICVGQYEYGEFLDDYRDDYNVLYDDFALEFLDEGFLSAPQESNVRISNNIKCIENGDEFELLQGNVPNYENQSSIYRSYITNASNALVDNLQTSLTATVFPYYEMMARLLMSWHRRAPLSVDYVVDVDEWLMPPHYVVYDANSSAESFLAMVAFAFDFESSQATGNAVAILPFDEISTITYTEGEKATGASKSRSSSDGEVGHKPVTINPNAADILSVDVNQVLNIDLSQYAKTENIHPAVTIDQNSSTELYLYDGQIIGIDLSAYAKTENLHPAVSLGTGSEPELALNPTTQVLTLTGLKKTFLSLNDTPSAYPTTNHGEVLICGTDAVLYADGFGVDAESAWASTSAVSQQYGNECVNNFSFITSASGWTLGSGWTYEVNLQAIIVDSTNAPTAGVVSQSITLTAGIYYLISIGFKLSTGSIDVKIGSETIVTLTAGSTDWRVVDLYYTAPTSDAVTLTLTPSGVSTDMGIDKVSIRQEITVGGSGLRVVDSSHNELYRLPTSAADELDFMVMGRDKRLEFKSAFDLGLISEDFFQGVGLLMKTSEDVFSEIPGTIGQMVYHDGLIWKALPKGTNNQVLKVNSDIPTWTDDTALVDADFATNGIMVRTGAGTYSTVADNSATWNTLASLGTKTFWNGTQAAYDAIGTKDSNTIYFINV